MVHPPSLVSISFKVVVTSFTLSLMLETASLTCSVFLMLVLSVHPLMNIADSSTNATKRNAFLFILSPQTILALGAFARIADSVIQTSAA